MKGFKWLEKLMDPEKGPMVLRSVGRHADERPGATEDGKHNFLWKYREPTRFLTTSNLKLEVNVTRRK